MSKNGGQKKFRRPPRSSPAAYLWCRPCQKRLWEDKRAARAAKNGTGGGAKLNVYRCPQEGSDGWHVGHLPPAVKRGEVSRADLVASRKVLE